MPSARGRVLIIAGSDSGGGAGVAWAGGWDGAPGGMAVPGIPGMSWAGADWVVRAAATPSAIARRIRMILTMR